MRGVGPGQVDDCGGGLLLGRTRVEIDVDEVAELAARLVGVDRGRTAGDVGAGYRHGPHLTQQFDGYRVQRHPQHHRAAGIAEIPLQRRRLLHHEAQRAGPERADQVAGPVGHGVDEALDGVPGADQHAHRHVSTPSLRRQQGGHRRAVERVGADAVHGVGRHDNQSAALERPCRRGDSARRWSGSAQSKTSVTAWLPGKRVVLRLRAVTNLGRPARSRRAADSSKSPVLSINSTVLRRRGVIVLDGEAGRPGAASARPGGRRRRSPPCRPAPRTPHDADHVRATSGSTTAPSGT